MVTGRTRSGQVGPKLENQNATEPVTESALAHMELPDMSERTLKRRLGIAEETVRIKKERLDDAEQEYEEEHRSFTVFTQRLAEKWEQRFESLAHLARDAGVRQEDIAAVRSQPWRESAAMPKHQASAAQREAAQREAAQRAAEKTEAATAAEAAQWLLGQV